MAVVQDGHVREEVELLKDHADLGAMLAKLALAHRDEPPLVLALPDEGLRRPRPRRHPVAQVG